MKSQHNRFFNLLRWFMEGVFLWIRTWNERSIGWIFALYAVVTLHEIFPAIPREWYTFENFTLLILAQVLLFSLSRAESVVRFARQYFQYLGNYASGMSLLLVVVTVVWLLILPTNEIPKLLQPVLILFLLTVFISIFQLPVTFRFFAPVEIGESGIRNAFLAAIWWGIFLSWYTYRFVWWSIGIPYPGMVSILLWTGFFVAFMYWVTDFRRVVQDRLFHMGHLDRNRILRSFRVFRIIGGIALVSGLSAFAHVWYTEYSAREAAEVARLAAQAIPAPRIPDPASEEFSPALLALIDQEKARREASVGSGATLSGSTQTGTLSTGENLTGTTSADARTLIGDVYPGKRYIGLGNTGDDVLWIQKLLTREGYYSGPLNRTFDALTSDAFGKFLRAKTGTTATYSQLWPKTMEVFKSIRIKE